ncbi:MAG: hypothetical protein IPJ82_25370 [Lewinellaceae bacterium]|nr:hypothetical protein [Lewinellaceae bacterium]
MQGFPLEQAMILTGGGQMSCRVYGAFVRRISKSAIRRVRRIWKSAVQRSGGFGNPLYKGAADLEIRRTTCSAFRVKKLVLLSLPAVLNPDPLMQNIQTSIELGVDLMKDIVAAGYSFLKEKNGERDFWGVATRRYVKNLLEDYGSVRVLGMEDEVPLDNLYVRANIIEKITSRSSLLPEEMER